ncbi:hypothetical protein ABVK25_007968 [Lepraria finkii]|uniref:Uncharacterized protein n=1 Tax=Lepraria finkii TaxID=1340010 RepID=A0ABR4B3G1_9LECA
MGQLEQINVELPRAQWGLIVIGNFLLWWSAIGSLRKKSKTFTSLVDDLYEKNDDYKYSLHNPEKPVQNVERHKLITPAAAGAKRPAQTPLPYQPAPAMRSARCGNGRRK